ncbi:ABC transporter ATP-binding protein [Dongia rigui]|uniref:ABC transporter ATP-binding protein n=1 Tax=Dongia rigui TaxID=940149 RepID=A0ABU5DT17_9PROT|nr:ABC transporter ATP-binding protein [Dongia rigui]MDY0870504.1 ABC transporter ATP-binding protein [Dongia rigui]
MALLEAQGMIGGYGGMDILNGVDLTVGAHEIVVIIGANGAGKSTAMKALFGLVALREGRVSLDGKDITNAAPNALVAAGMGFVPQERNVFRTLTVRENLEMGGFLKPAAQARVMEQVFDLFPVLKEKANQPAGELSGGQRQMVAVGRALMTEPRLLMLDEPTAGLSPLMMEQIFDRILAINREGIGILLVEQNARQALAIAHRGYVLATGRNRFTGTAEALLGNPEIGQSFLGG